MIYLKNKPLSRRTFIHSGCSALSLPLLEAMMPTKQAAAQQLSPQRLMLFYTPNGVWQEAWRPSGDGQNYTLGSSMRPLQELKDQVTVITGMTNQAQKDSNGKPHPRATGTLFTQKPLQNAKADNTSAGWADGISLDQYVATKAAFKDGMLAPSLSMGTGLGRRGAMSTISYTGPGQPVPRQVSHAAVFNLFFKGQTPGATFGGAGGGKSDAELIRQLNEKRSILDFVREDYGRLKAKISAGDRARVEQHFESLRSIEEQISALDTRIKNNSNNNSVEDGPSCTVPSDQDAGGNEPPYPEKLVAWTDIITAVFSCDLTRVASLMIGTGGGGGTYSFLGLNNGYHGYSHQGGGAKGPLSTIDTYHYESIGNIAKSLRSVQEGETDILSSSIIYCCDEFGNGDRHDVSNLPAVLIGGGKGKLKPGQRLTKQGQNIADLHVGVLNALGIEDNSFGNAKYNKNPVRDILS